MSNKTGVVFDNRYFNHTIPAHSPENPERIRRIYQELGGERYNGRYERVEPLEISTADILSVHSSLYLDQLREHSVNGNPYSYDRDTYLVDDSLFTARLATGGCLALADKIMSKELQDGFAFIRPPGHHAEGGRGMGFCILNNVALTAQYLLDVHNLKRILIIDYDVHHGNGTQEVFYESDQVMFISIHQKDIFPFTGAADEIGKEKGQGYNVNIPVFAQFGDIEYTYLVGRMLQSLVEQYMPQFILVSAGFDGHIEDNISGTMLSTNWYSQVTRMLSQYASEFCSGNILFVLEGGYNPFSLEEAALATFDALLDPTSKGKIGVMRSQRAEKLLVNHPINEYWTLELWQLHLFLNHT